MQYPQSLIKSQPLRGPFSLWPRTADAALGVFVFVLALVFTLTTPDQPYYNQSISQIPVLLILATLIASASLFWRRDYPLQVLAVVLSTSALVVVMGYSDCPLFPFVFALYSVGRYANHERWSYIAFATTFVFVALCNLNTLQGENPWADFLFSLIFTFVIWYVGRRIRIRGEYMRLLQERAQQLEKEQDQEARRAVAEERARIAREMHDVVAHQVSLMTVQAGAAKTVAIDNPKDALQAMEAVEKAGRQALNELRHLISILRPNVSGENLDPQPGVEEIPRLVEHLAHAGLDISLESEKHLPTLPTRVNLSAYRIIQEALTNVLKHAGPGAQVKVSIKKVQTDLYIEVLDHGQGNNILPGSGHGIVGMRERAQLLGGTLEAGPVNNGFRVWAKLPMEDGPQ